MLNIIHLTVCTLYLQYVHYTIPYSMYLILTVCTVYHTLQYVHYISIKRTRKHSSYKN